jgi:MFS family permease
VLRHTSAGSNTLGTRASTPTGTPPTSARTISRSSSTSPSSGGRGGCGGSRLLAHGKGDLDEGSRVTTRFERRHTDAHGGGGSVRRRRLRLPKEGESLGEERTLLLLLGLPTFGLALAMSVLTAYGPVVLIRLTQSTSQVGALIGGEGAFALLVPLVSGTLSDRLRGPPGARRLPFVLAGVPLVAAGIAVLAFSNSYWLAAGSVLAFFVGYYLYYPPYRALYADLLPRSFYARAQASQAVLRGVGLGVALLTGGLLLSLWLQLPFVIAAGVVVATALALAPVLRLGDERPAPAPSSETVSIRRLLGNRELRSFAAANVLWEFSFTGLKSFIVLYVVQGLGRSPSTASAVIAVVAVAYVVGAPLAGFLADRYGIVRVLRLSSLVYGAGLVVGVVPHTLGPLLIGLPVVALAGAIVMTLPQALAFSVAPARSEGAAAGIQDFSRGVGVVLGPVAVGAAIDASASLFDATQGYAAMWPVIGIPVLLSLLALRRLRAADEPAAAGRRG